MELSKANTEGKTQTVLRACLRSEGAQFECLEWQDGL